MPDNRVVTELIVDASGAQAGTAQYDAAMTRAQASANATIATNDKVQASINRQTVSMTASYGRQASQFERLAAGASDVIRAQQLLEKATLSGTAAVAVGRRTQDEVNNVISIYEARLAAATAATGANSAAQEANAVAAHGMAEAESEAALASAAVTRELIVLGREGLVGNFSRLPGSILALNERLQSTGTSVLNVSTLFKIFGSLAATIFNPLVIGIVGVSVALEVIPRLFSSIHSSASEVETDLKTHKDLVDQITKAYEAADDAAKQYAGESGTLLRFKLNTDVLSLTKDLNSQLQDVFNALGGFGTRFSHAANVGNPFGPFQDQVDQLKRDINNGVIPDLQAVEDRIAAFALNDPSNQKLQDTATKLLGILDAAKQTEAGLNQAKSLQSLLGTDDWQQTAAAAALKLGGHVVTVPNTDQRLQFLNPNALKTATKDANELQKAFDDAMKSAAGETKAVQDQITTFGMSAEATAEYTMRQKLLTEAQKDQQAITPALIASIDVQARAYGEATATLDKMKAAQSTQQQLAQTFYGAVDGAKSFGDAVRQLGLDILNLIKQATLLGTGPLATLFGTSGGANSGGLLGQLIGGFLRIGGAPAATGAPTPIASLFSAKGNVFANDNVVPFARGGIVNHPALFKFAQGTGLMGEAGPEAIMPLKRGPDGNLGVQMHGGGGNAQIVVQNVVNNNSSAQVTQRQERTPNGIKLITDIMDQHTASGGFDRAMKGRFGMKPQKIA